MLAAPAARMAKFGEAGQLIGMMFTIGSISSLTGGPIAGAILASSRGIQGVSEFSGQPRYLEFWECRKCLAD